MEKLLGGSPRSFIPEGWQDDHGGQLELWSRDMKQCVRKVAPVFNRALIFNTDVDAFHGHPEATTCPDGVTRKSLALYNFSVEPQPFLVRSTEYRARPGDGLKAVAIYLDKTALRGYDRVKRIFGIDDRFASRSSAFSPDCVANRSRTGVKPFR